MLILPLPNADICFEPKLWVYCAIPCQFKQFLKTSYFFHFDGRWINIEPCPSRFRSYSVQVYSQIQSPLQLSHHLHSLASFGFSFEFLNKTWGTSCEIVRACHMLFALDCLGTMLWVSVSEFEGVSVSEWEWVWVSLREWVWVSVSECEWVWGSECEWVWVSVSVSEFEGVSVSEFEWVWVSVSLSEWVWVSEFEWMC